MKISSFIFPLVNFIVLPVTVSIDHSEGVENNAEEEETMTTSSDTSTVMRRTLRKLSASLPTLEEQKCDRAYRRLWEREEMLRNTSNIYAENLTATITSLEFFDVCQRDDSGLAFSCVYPTDVPAIYDFANACSNVNATLLNETTTFSCRYDTEEDGRGQLTMTYPLQADCIPLSNPNCELDYFREKQEVEERALQRSFKNFLETNDFKGVYCSNLHVFVDF